MQSSLEALTRFLADAVASLFLAVASIDGPNSYPLLCGQDALYNTIEPMRSRISAKGRITIPIEIREALGLRAGTPVVFERHPGGALLRKGTTDEHPVDRIYGVLKRETSVDGLLDEMRGLRPAAARARRRGP